MFSPDQWLASTGVSFYNDVATQSLRFDDGRSTYLSRTGNIGTNTTFTFSAWFKRTSNSGTQSIFGAGNSGSNFFTIRQRAIGDDGKIEIVDYTGSIGFQLKTNAIMRDFSAWYHLVLAIDTTKTTGTPSNSDRIKLYINGVRITDFAIENYGSSSNYATRVSSGLTEIIGSELTSEGYFDGYVSEVNFVDGTQLTPSSFGETKNGVWIPKEYTGSYGTNGFRLQFNQTGTGTASASTIGADTSGIIPPNHFASSGIDTSDCNMPDSPENNFATLNPLDKSFASSALSEGNLSVSAGTGNAWNNIINSTFSLTSGKWYWEVYQNGTGGFGKIGVRQNNSLTSANSHSAGASEVYLFNGNKQQGSTSTDSSYYGSAMYADGNIFGVALDMDAGKIWVAKANTYGGSADPTTGNGAMFTNLTEPQSPSFSSYNMAVIFNFGQDGSFAGELTSGIGTATDGNGNGVFKYAPPSGFLALCTSNLPEPTISPNALTQADDYFNTVLWNGNATAKTISGVGFAPDWVWLKSRTHTDWHNLFDTSRGANDRLVSNNANAEETTSGHLTAFTSDGFDIGTNSNVNRASNTYVAWNWKANGGTTSSNTDGSITSTVQANTTAGFSIVTYTGNGTNGATIGHSLGVKPAMISFKNRDSTAGWATYHKELGATKLIYLDLPNAATSSDAHLNNTEPTDTLITLHDHVLTNSSDDYVAYCFAEIEGYSKFGSYIGNGSNDGTFVHLGFRPAFIMTKRTNSTSNWVIQDSVRQTFNPSDAWLRPNEPDDEGDTSPDLDLDFVSNGFKIRNNGTDNNILNSTYIYMAFAEAPFKYANSR